MVNKLLLLSRNDIPFIQAQINIHQPVIKEIAYIGEDAFFTGCEFLNFSKDKLSQQDKLRLDHLSNFEVLMTIMKNDDVAIKQRKVCIELVLLLLFPDYKVNFLPSSIMLFRKNGEELEQHLIDKENFESFRNIVSDMFCLKSVEKNVKKYNPGGAQAAALVKKFQEREKKLAKLKGRGQDGQGISMLYQYVSILSVGEHKDMNELLQYTVYQLFDEFRRFKKKQNFDIYVQAKMAGAKDLDEIENWMGDVHSDTL